MTAPPERRRPSMWMRILLLGFGWALIALGIAGLFLPGLQGILTLLAGGALLSVASDRVHRLLRRLLQRWPALSQRFETLREKLHDRLSRH